MRCAALLRWTAGLLVALAVCLSRGELPAADPERAAGANSTAGTQPSAGPQTDLFSGPGLPVRRVFVPAAQPSAWPAGNWVPIEPRRLRELLDNLPQSSSELTGFPFAHATWRARVRIEDGRLTDGTAELEPSASWSGAIPLDPINVALGGAWWRGEERDQPAILGTDGRGRHMLIPDRPAKTLLLDWQLAGQRRLRGFEFTLKLPAAVVSTLELTAPAGWELSASTGILTESRQPDQDSVWRLDLGLRNECRIRVLPPGSTEAEAATGMLCRMNSRGVISLARMDTVHEIALESLPATAESVHLRIPSGMQIISVTQRSGSVLDWQDLGEISMEVRRVKVPLPRDDTAATTRDITLRLAQPPQPNGSWSLKLPIVEEALLLDGQVSITVEAGLMLEALQPTGMRQTGSTIDFDRRLLEFQQYLPEAGLNIGVRRSGRSESGSVTVRGISVLHQDQSPPALETELELISQSRDVFDISALLPREWEVAQVSLRNPDGTAADLVWNIRPGREQHAVLQVTLAEGLPVNEPVRLLVTARQPVVRDPLRRRVPVLLPENVTSASLAVAVTGGADVERTTIVSTEFTPVSPAAFAPAFQWSKIAGDLKTQPAAFWSVEYWNSPAELLAAVLTIPDAPAAVVAPRPIGPLPQEPGDRAAPGPESVAPLVPDIIQPQPLVPERTGPSRKPIVTVGLESQLSPGTAGRDLHRLKWRFVYAAQLGVLKFNLPAGSELLRVSLNDQAIAAGGSLTEWSVPIPSVNAGDSIAVEYTLPSQDMYLRETYRTRIPSAAVSVVGFDWAIRLQREFAVVSFSNELIAERRSAQVTWRRWFFGPLARPAGEPLFNPFSPDAWDRLLGDSDDRRSGSIRSLDWETYSASADGLPQSLTVHLCHRQRLHVMAWFVFFVSMLVGVLLRAARHRQRNRIGLLWLSGCVFTGLLIPSVYAELIGAAGLGTVLATLLPRSLARSSLLAPARTSLPSHSSMTRTVTIARPRLNTWLLMSAGLAAGALTGTLNAQVSTDPASRPGPAAAAVPPAQLEVLIPYEGDAFPGGSQPDVVFVRDEALKQLRAAQKPAEIDPLSALLTEADWTGTVDDSGRPRFTVRLSVSVSPDLSHLTLPIPTRYLDPREPGRLDDQPVPVLPDRDGKAVILALPGSGSSIRGGSSVSVSSQAVAPPLPEQRLETAPNSDSPVQPPSSTARLLHTVTLVLRPQVTVVNEDSVMTLPMPPVLLSRARLSFATRPLTLIDRTTGAPIALDDRASGLLPGGPVSEISLRWRSGTLAAASSPEKAVPDVIADLRSAVDLHPSFRQRRMLVHYTPNGRSVRYAALRLPPTARLNRQQVKASSLADLQLDRTADGLLVTMEFDPPQTREFDVVLSWYEGTPADPATPLVWSIPVTPAGQSQSVQVRSYLAGLTAAAGFEPDPLLKQSIEAAAPTLTQYLDLWPASDRPRNPQIITAITPSSKLIGRVTPLQVVKTVRQDQAARVTEGSIDWTIRAEVETTVAPAFIHEFQIPPEIRIDQVRVQEDFVDRLSHWDQRQGRLVLHLRDRTSGVQNILIHGRQPLSARASSVPVPRVQMVDAKLTESTLTCYQSPGLRVAARGAELIETTDSPVDFSGRYRLRDSQAVSLQVDRVELAPEAWSLAVLENPRRPDGLLRLVTRMQSLNRRDWVLRLPDWRVKQGVPVEVTVDRNEATATFDRERSEVRIRVTRPLPADVLLSLNIPLDLSSPPVTPLAAPVLTGVNQHTTVLAVAIDSGLSLKPLTAAAEETLDRLTVLGFALPQRSAVADPSAPRADEDRDSAAQEPPRPLPVYEFADWQAGTELALQQTLAPGVTLPPLVVHTLRPGERQTGIAATQACLDLADATSTTILWPEGYRVVSVRADGQFIDVPETPEGRTLVPLDAGRRMHLVELLWERPDRARHLKVMRDELALPVFESAESAFVFAVPAPGVDLLPSGRIVDSTVGQHLHALVEDWHEAALRESVLNPGHSRTLSSLQDSLNLLHAAQHGEPLTAPSGRKNLTPTAKLTGVTSMLVTVDDPTLLMPAPVGTVSYWVVDQRLNRVVISFAAAILALPLLALLFILETGDRLAEKPAAAWLVIGTVWWLCLQGSPPGFVMVALAALWFSLNALRNKPEELRTASEVV